MRLNSINTFNYSKVNNNSRPVFKQHQESIYDRAIVDQFIAADKEDISTGNPVKKMSFLKTLLFSKENDKQTKLLKEVLANYDSIDSILFKI
jgi:hypothetical protein